MYLSKSPVLHHFYFFFVETWLWDHWSKNLYFTIPHMISTYLEDIVYHIPDAQLWLPAE